MYILISRRMAKTLEKLHYIKVEPKKDISLDGMDIKLFKGVEAEVPRWLADKLEEKGFIVKKKIDPKIISELYYKEKVSITPLEIPPYTYSLIREILKSSPKDSLIRRDSLALVNRRISKIMSYIRTSLTLRTNKTPKNLLLEELILYNALKIVLDEWMNSFLELRDESNG